jgi:hypothetical protein
MSDSVSLHCKKCLTGRSEDKLGDPCKTRGCDGVVEEVPDFATLVDVLPEPMTCPRRMSDPGPFKILAGPDHWQKFKAAHGNRVCSYCGSLHPDDFLALVKLCAEAGEEVEYSAAVQIEPSDKGYKIYVHQPGVRNAHEGGIKFYTPHLPRDAAGKIAVTREQEVEYDRAVKATHARFDRYMASRHPIT